jgi:peptidoglycan hydrolase CwlO-like protein
MEEETRQPTEDEQLLASIKEAEGQVGKLRTIVRHCTEYYGEHAVATSRAQGDLHELMRQLDTLRQQRREALPAATRRTRVGQAMREATKKLGTTRAQLEDLANEATKLETRRQELLLREEQQEAKLAKLEAELAGLEPDEDMAEGEDAAAEAFEAVTQLKAERAAKDFELESMRTQLAAAQKEGASAGETVPAGGDGAGAGSPGAGATSSHGREASAVADLQSKRRPDAKGGAGDEEPPPPKK